MADETVAEDGGTATADKTYSERVERILTEMEQLSLLEIVELKDGIEGRFGVTAAMPAMAMAPMAGAGGGDGGAAEEKTAFDVVLKDFGSEKIQVIKEVRGITSLGLKEAKALVEDLPKPVKEGVSKEEADKVKEQLEKVGATVEIK